MIDQQQLQEAFEKAGDEIAAALGRSFELKFECCAPEPHDAGSESHADHMSTPGICLVMEGDESSVVVILRRLAGWMPGWVSSPDENQSRRLQTLALELGSKLLPADAQNGNYDAYVVADVMTSLNRIEIGADSIWSVYELQIGEVTDQMLLVTDCTNCDALSDEVAATAADSGADSAGAEGADSPAAQGGAEMIEAGAPQARAADLDALPDYIRSLLRIEVPVCVTLAETQIPLKQILEIGLGTIIQFDKSCEETLSLRAGGHEVALGEAVKVGDKFGLKVTSILMPPERFLKVRGKTPEDG